MSGVRPGGGGAAPAGGIPLGRILSVPVQLSWSWFIIAAFIVVSFGPVVAFQFPRLGALAWVVALGYAVLLLLSVLAHELAHALTARAFGWPSARIVLTLWGGHTSFESMPATAGKSLVVALAGPVANFALAGAGALITALATPVGTVGWLLASVFTVANLFVGVFNVLPGLPLDGGRIVESAVWRATGNQARGTVAAGWAGRIIAVAIVVLILWPLAVGRGPSLQTLLIGLLVAGFLWAGATGAIRSGRLKQRLGTVSAGRLARPAAGVPARSSVAQLAALAQDLRRTGPGAALILVDDRGVPVAVVDPDAVTAVPPERAASTGSAAVARPLAAGAVVPEVAEGQQLVQYLAQLAGSEYAVIDGRGVITGLLTQAAVLAALQGRDQPW